MGRLRAFDYKSFRAEYVQLKDMSCFERANFKAERSKAAKRAAATDWWKNRSYWDVIGEPDSVVEIEALVHVLSQIPVIQPPKEIPLATLEAMLRHAMTLRSLAKGRDWVDINVDYRAGLYVTRPTSVLAITGGTI